MCARTCAQRPKRLQLINKIEEPKEAYKYPQVQLIKKIEQPFSALRTTLINNKISYKQTSPKPKMSAISMIQDMASRLTQDERIALAVSILQGLKGGATAAAPTPAAEAKPKKAKKEVDPDAPKKEANYFIKATAVVREALKPLIDAHNSALGEGEKKMAGTVPVRVASMLKDAGHLSADIMPTKAQIEAAFHSFVADPPEVKPKKASSVTSTESKKSKEPKAELSDDEKAAKRKASAAKAAATRAANKAKKAAGGEAVTIEAVAEALDADAPFILKGRSYLRIDNALWDSATDLWVGEYDPKTGTIDTSATEPDRVYE